MGCDRPVKGFKYLSSIDKKRENRLTPWFFDPVSKGVDQILMEMAEGPETCARDMDWG
jgi:hypothetical protein